MKKEEGLLTVRQLQDLLQVDRVTIYRMLKRGTLQGVKVGGQWRFRRDQVEAWLEQRRKEQVQRLAGPLPPEGEWTSEASSLPLSCVLPIQAIFAEAMRLAAVTLDARGTPLTPVSNCSALCTLILATDEGRRRCLASWQGARPGEFRPCHAGLLTLSAPVWVEGQQVATVVACQFAAPVGEGEAWQDGLAALAGQLGLQESALRAAAGSIRTMPGEDLQRLARLLHLVAQTFSEIGEEWRSLIARLRQIAAISQI
ncbi:MAG: PocR ligand-binding domain-containing protein [Anaerolineae bacterium]